MEQHFRLPLFSRAILTAVFVGIFTTVITIVLQIFFVEDLKFPLADYINVSTLIFGVNLIFFIVGFIYYAFISTSKRGEMLFIVLFVLLTILFAVKAQGAHRVADPHVNLQFRNLLAAIIIIIGIQTVVTIPLLFHSKKFEEHVL